MPSKHLLVTLLVLMPILGCTPSPTRQQPVEPHLLMPFDDGLHGCLGAANPFAAIGHCRLVEDEHRKGKVLQMAGHDPRAGQNSRPPRDRSAVVIDGVNVPVRSGTVGFSVRLDGARQWTDRRRTWLAVLLPKVVALFGRAKADATALAVWKSKDGDVELCEYRFETGRLSTELNSVGDMSLAEPDRILLKLPAKHLGKDDWARIRFGWDRTTSTAWLGLDDKVVSCKADLGKAPHHVLLLGTPPVVRWTWEYNAGPDGRLDDVMVTGKTLGDDPLAAFEMPADRPPMATPSPARIEAVHLVDDKQGRTHESIARTHLHRVIQLQQVGGWCFGAAWPSRMFFLSSLVVVPYRDMHFNGSKGHNSALIATRLMGGYVATGDGAMLEGARRTARTLLALQADDGAWPYNAEWDPENQRFVILKGTDDPPLQDHVQSHPTLLMLMLHQATGQQVYLDSARKGIAFIYKTQNPNGSWSHHWSRKLGAGESARGYVYGGEINDFTTADQMRIMLLAWRMTGEVKYLASYVRAADWLAEAFIDKKAKGWAQQYDRNNRPVQARHFEPAAVGYSEGSDSAPLGLIAAWRLTGDRRYLGPLRKWRRWMLDNRVFTNDEKTRWGWHTYYDPEDGKPFYYVKRQRRTPGPKAVREGGYTRILKLIENLEQPGKPGYVPGPETARAELKKAEGDLATAVRQFDWTAGSWIKHERSPTGGKIMPGYWRAGPMCWSVFLRRQLAGQIPWDHRLSTLGFWQWTDPFCLVMPPRQLNAPLTDDQYKAARTYIAEHPIKPKTDLLKTGE